ncbi:MAG: diacylglycerol kinase family protein [Candidatus Zixiibacteriota bacterium]
MRIKVIINPKSKNGNPKYLKAILKEKLRLCYLDIEETIYPQHATEITMKAAKKNFDTIVAVGGDGTINEVLNGIVGTDISLGIIPMGTANDLATFCGIPKDPVKACKVILNGHLHCADVIGVNDRYYVTAGGLGFPSEVIRIANRMKCKNIIVKLLGQFMGSKIYILAVLYALLKKSREKNFLKIRWNDSSIYADSLSLMLNNQPFLGKHFLMSPGAVNNDGRFDVCLIGNDRSRFQILSILLKVLTGKHVRSSSVSTWHADKLVVTSEKPLAFFGDGEIIQQGTQFKIQIIPEALKIIVPDKKERL